MLSGGQRTRARLAYLLLKKPDLLVLDEPTNHLDISSVEWLEGYLNKWDGAVLIVSHDRYFLDRVVNIIWEMSLSGFEVYRGNYSAYIHQRQERWDLRRKIFDSEKLRLDKELDYIKRNIAGQRTSQARGKLRRLSREVQAIESLGVEGVKGEIWAKISGRAKITEHTLSVAEVEQRIKALKKPTNYLQNLNLDLIAHNRSGDLVLRTKDLVVGYADDHKVLFKTPDLLLKRGECAAVIGPNGAGKTTFLKTLLAQIPPLSGEVILGASLQIGYFAQAHEDLKPERTLIEEIEEVSPHMLLAEMRNYLARFLFTGDDVFRKVATLSGGERGRLALAKLSLASTNLLLLDEPTNHLDIPSQEILQSVLTEYQGTTMLISHDRFLIDALGTQIWEIHPGTAQLSVYEGTYSQYRIELEERLSKYSEEKVADRRKTSTLKRRGLASELERKRKSRILEIEDEIADLEIRLDALAKELENPPSAPQKVQSLGTDYVRFQEELDNLIAEWEQLHD
jgi:ATP-binding cassette subfamily F protein 3